MGSAARIEAAGGAKLVVTMHYRSLDDLPGSWETAHLAERPADLNGKLPLFGMQ
jgi:hypothetical protein